MYLVLDREVSDSNPGGFKSFSPRLLFESNSSDISRFMFFPCCCFKMIGTFVYIVSYVD